MMGYYHHWHNDRIGDVLLNDDARMREIVEEQYAKGNLADDIHDFMLDDDYSDNILDRVISSKGDLRDFYNDMLGGFMDYMVGSWLDGQDVLDEYHVGEYVFKLCREGE